MGSFGSTAIAFSAAPQKMNIKTKNTLRQEHILPVDAAAPKTAAAKAARPPPRPPRPPLNRWCPRDRRSRSCRQDRQSRCCGRAAAAKPIRAPGPVGSTRRPAKPPAPARKPPDRQHLCHRPQSHPQILRRPQIHHRAHPARDIHAANTSSPATVPSPPLAACS